MRIAFLHFIYFISKYAFEFKNSDVPFVAIKLNFNFLSFSAMGKILLLSSSIEIKTLPFDGKIFPQAI